jgi:hypothetical protein
MSSAMAFQSSTSIGVDMAARQRTCIGCLARGAFRVEAQAPRLPRAAAALTAHSADGPMLSGSGRAPRYAARAARAGAAEMGAADGRLGWRPCVPAGPRKLKPQQGTDPLLMCIFFLGCA